MNPIVILILAIILNIIAQVLLKISSKSLTEITQATNLVESVLSTVRNPLLIISAISYFLAFVTYFLALSKFELSKAYPLVSVTVIVATLILSVLFLDESLNAAKVAGIAFCCVGIALIFLQA